MLPIYGTKVVNRDGLKKPETVIVKWRCSGNCGTWIPHEESIDDIWKDEQHLKHSMSSHNSTSKSGRKKNKKREYISKWKQV